MKRKEAIGFAFLVVMVDHIVKLIITSNLREYSAIPVVENFFNITYIKNTGAAWGLFQGNELVLGILGLLVAFAIYVLLVRDSKMTEVEGVSYGILIGGIMGNVIDRFTRLGVVDYFDFKIFGYDFPVFNLADICIVLSLIVIVIAQFDNGGKHGTVKY